VVTGPEYGGGVQTFAPGAIKPGVAHVANNARAITGAILHKRHLTVSVRTFPPRTYTVLRGPKQCWKPGMNEHGADDGYQMISCPAALAARKSYTCRAVLATKLCLTTPAHKTDQQSV